MSKKVKYIGLRSYQDIPDEPSRYHDQLLDCEIELLKELVEEAYYEGYKACDSDDSYDIDDRWLRSHAKATLDDE